jgi:hypothetical protein
MKNLILVSSIPCDLLPASQRWLVIGPQCWGQSRSLAKALELAELNRGYAEGQFTARIMPARDFQIDHAGYPLLNAMDKEEREQAEASLRLVAVTRGAAKRYAAEFKTISRMNRKELAKP